MERDDASKPDKSHWPNLVLLMFGVTLLLFLIAIDREEWFHIRPVSGTAQAMTLASDREVGRTP